MFLDIKNTHLNNICRSYTCFWTLKIRTLIIFVGRTHVSGHYKLAVLPRIAPSPRLQRLAASDVRNSASLAWILSTTKR